MTSSPASHSVPPLELRAGDRLVGWIQGDLVRFRGFATQRDVSRTKRDIKTFEIRLRCDNANRTLAVGMTAYVDLPLK